MPLKTEAPRFLRPLLPTGAAFFWALERDQKTMAKASRWKNTNKITFNTIEQTIIYKENTNSSNHQKKTQDLFKRDQKVPFPSQVMGFCPRSTSCRCRCGSLDMWLTWLCQKSWTDWMVSNILFQQAIWDVLGWFTVPIWQISFKWQNQEPPSSGKTQRIPGGAWGLAREAGTVHQPLEMS